MIAVIRGALRSALVDLQPDEPTATDEHRVRVVEVLEQLRDEVAS